MDRKNLVKIFKITLKLIVIGLLLAFPNSASAAGLDFVFDFFGTNKNSYNTGETVNLWATIKNTGTVEIDAAIADFSIVSPSGQTVFADKNSDSYIHPGSLSAISTEWTIPNNVNPGQYTAKVTITARETPTGPYVTKQNSYNFNVNAPSGNQGYTISLSSGTSDGSYSNVGLIYFTSPIYNTYNLPASVILQNGQYEIMGCDPQASTTGGKHYLFDHWETSGSVSVANSLKAGTTLTVSGSGSLKCVTSKFDFSLSTSPSQQTVNAGDTAYFTISISGFSGFTSNNGYNSYIDLAPSESTELPPGSNRPGITAYINQNQQSTTATFNIITSQDTPPGTYPITITGTTYGADNPIVHSQTVSIIVSAPQVTKPDLIIQDLYWTPSNPAPGDIVTFTYTEKNQGDGDATGHRVTLYIDDIVISSDNILETLPVGSTRTRTFSDKWTATSGGHDAFVKADSTEGITESNDENNGLHKTIGTKETVPTTLTINLNPSSISENTNTYVTVSGKLTNSNSGSGIPNRPIKLEWTGGMTTVTTNSNGDYSYTTDVTYSKGTYQFSAKFDGYETSSTIYVSSSSTASLAVSEIINQPPTAYIDYISPNPATQGQIVYFSGSGSDPDGSIIAYNWISSKDGQLSISNAFGTSSLSQGTHTVYFKVKDNSGSWSSEISKMLTISPQEQTKTVSLLDPANKKRDSVDISTLPIAVQNIVKAYSKEGEYIYVLLPTSELSVDGRSYGFIDFYIKAGEGITLFFDASGNVVEDDVTLVKLFQAQLLNDRLGELLKTYGGVISVSESEGTPEHLIFFSDSTVTTRSENNIRNVMIPFLKDNIEQDQKSLNEVRMFKTISAISGAGIRLVGELYCPNCLLDSPLSVASLAVDETEYMHNLFYFADEKTGEVPKSWIPWDERFKDMLLLGINIEANIDGFKLLRKINNDWRLAAKYIELYEKNKKNTEYLEKAKELTTHTKDVATHIKGLMSLVLHYAGEGTLKKNTDFAINFEIGYTREIYDMTVMQKILQKRLDEGKLSYIDFNRYNYLVLDSNLALYSNVIETKDSYKDVVGSSFASYIVMQGGSISVYQNVDRILDMIEKNIEDDLDQYEKMINFVEKRTGKSLNRLGKPYTRKSSFNKNELMDKIRAIRAIRLEEIEPSPTPTPTPSFTPIVTSTPTPTLTPTPMPTPYPTPSPGATPYLGSTPPPITPYIKGDANDDGFVNVIDSLLVSQHTVGTGPLSASQLGAADVNCDGNVNVVDALFISQYTVGLKQSFC